MFLLPLASYLASGSWFWVLLFLKFSRLTIYNWFCSPSSLLLGLLLSSVFLELEFVASLFIFFSFLFLQFFHFFVCQMLSCKNRPRFFCNPAIWAGQQKSPKIVMCRAKKIQKIGLIPPENTPKHQKYAKNRLEPGTYDWLQAGLRKKLTWALCMGALCMSDTASTNKICRHVSSEKCPQARSFHDWERVV